MFRNFVVAASTVADTFFFDDNHPREIDAKSYTVGQFRLFYDAVVTLYAYLYGFANPHLVPSLTASLGILAADLPRVERLLVRLRKHTDVNTATAGEAYTHLIEEAGIGSPSIEPFTAFTSGCLVAYNSAFARYAD